MNVPIPHWVVKASASFADWGNAPVWLYEHPNWNGSKYTRPKIEIVRLDILIAGFFSFCVSYYAFFYGWRGALGGGLTFIIMAAFALFVRR